MIRCIGDPDVRFLEDPVRMLRAVVLAARLEFTIDEPMLESIAIHRHEIARSAPARLVEEYYKILRSGPREGGLHAAALDRVAEGHHARASRRIALWATIAALDRYRARFVDAPDTLTNAILAGTLLYPLGLIGRRQRFSADPLERRVELGLLPIARRDVERLHQILALQPRLVDIEAPARAQRACCTAPCLGKRSRGWKSMAIARMRWRIGDKSRSEPREHPHAAAKNRRPRRPPAAPPPAAPTPPCALRG